MQSFAAVLSPQSCPLPLFSSLLRVICRLEAWAQYSALLMFLPSQHLCFRNLFVSACQRFLSFSVRPLLALLLSSAVQPQLPSLPLKTLAFAWHDRALLVHQDGQDRELTLR